MSAVPLPDPTADDTALSEWPSITVVVPTRDRAELLDRTLRSIIGQDYPGAIQCLVVYDQAEAVAPALPSVPGREILITTNERLPGLPGARNHGALLARGDFVAFCDDDDEWLPTKLRRQIEEIGRREDVSLVSCGNLVRYGDRDIVRLPRSETVEFSDLIRSRVAVIHSSTILVRRNVFLNQIGLIDESIPAGGSEDYEWQLRAARVAPLLVVPEPLARIHWHSESRFAARWDIYADGLEYLLAKYPEFGGDRRGFARIAGQIAFARAALGDARTSLEWVRRCARADWRQPRLYLALLVAARIVGADTIVHRLHTAGRGI